MVVKKKDAGILIEIDAIYKVRLDFGEDRFQRKRNEQAA